MQEVAVLYNFKQDFYADVRVEDRFTTTIAYTNGFLNEIKERNEKRAFIRVFDGKMWYFASTTDLSDIQNKLDGLYLQAKPNSKILKNRIVKKFEVNNDVKMVFALNSVRNIDIAQKKALLESYLPTLSSSPLMSMPMATYVDRNSIFEFSSSKGAYIKYDYQTCGISLGCTLTSENDFLHADKQFV